MPATGLLVCAKGGAGVARSKGKNSLAAITMFCAANFCTDSGLDKIVYVGTGHAWHW
jgi:hypothetical protein